MSEPLATSLNFRLDISRLHVDCPISRQGFRFYHPYTESPDSDPLKEQTQHRQCMNEFSLL
ncbi:hypothetical protein K438DRAFT_1815002 [Mycena galopus ATCC 62051]|nr:hypothetical protein K438DRAFT_1815002 [Mycena galopus ATCC 62051]